MHINVSQTLQYHQQETCFLDLELAIDPPPPIPQGEFCTLWFSKTTLYKKQNDIC